MYCTYLRIFFLFIDDRVLQMGAPIYGEESGSMNKDLTVARAACGDMVTYIIVRQLYV